MCCLDTENYKCCCGCTLTVGTWILGGLICLNMIFSMIYGNWGTAGLEAVLLVFFALTIVDRHSVLYRKLLYYAYMVGAVLYVLGFLIAIIIVAIWPDWLAENVAEECMDNETMIDFFDSTEECLDKLKTWILAIVIICCLIGVPINLLCLRMLYYGM